jgi:very-short-patch-repair endonuclease
MKSSRPKFLSEDFHQYLIDNYTNGDKSIPEIAEEYGTYSNYIYRVMRKLGIPRKTRSEAQHNVLKSGKSPHPTKGTERAPEVKRKIGRKVYEKNLEISEEERQRRIEKNREIWLNIPEEVRKQYTKKSHDAMRKGGKRGSKLERDVIAALLGNKFKIQAHHKLNFADSEMTVDIFLPVEGVIIEIDGPIHFEALFGQSNLDRQIEKDLWKNEQLLLEGYSVIRVQNPKGYTSLSFVEDFIEKFIPFLKAIIQKDNNSFHEICITDREFKVKD